MKRFHFLTALAALAVTLPSLAGNPRDDEPYQTKTFSGNISAVRGETAGGSLIVEGGHSGGVKVEMFVRLNNWNGANRLDKAEIEERLREYDVVIRQEGGTVVATAKPREGLNRATDRWKRSLSIGFVFHTPRNVSTDLRTSGGSIRLSRLNGRQSFRTSGGSISLNDVQGDVDGRTSGGSINLANCRDRITLRTSGGSIEAVGSAGNLDLETSGGSIRLRDLSGTIRAETSGGSVQGDKIDGELITATSGGSVRLFDMAGSVDARTSAGSMEVEMAQLGSYLKLANSGGSVRVRMPMNKGMTLDVRGNRVRMPLTNFDGESGDDRIRGRINGGGIPVTISSSSGTVYINQN